MNSAKTHLPEHTAGAVKERTFAGKKALLKKRTLLPGSGRENLQHRLMALPAVVWYILFCYLPLFGIVFAFKQFTPRPGQSLFVNLFVNSPWAGFRNFSYLFRNPQCWAIIGNTLFYNVVFLIAGIALPVFLAILLSEIHQRMFSGIVQMVMILPYFLSWVIVGYCVYGFLATDHGQINAVLKFFGHPAVHWYQSPQYWRVILILVGIWKTCGYSLLIYLCSVTSIDRTLYESASLDGATFWQQIRHITLPLLRPTIATIFIMLPMVFSGGLVSSYMINTQVLHLRNTYLALILPGLCSTWYIMMMRNYFITSVPDSLIESAKIEGATPFQILTLIVVPICKPVIMTVAVFQIFAYWNSWYPALLYIDTNHTELYPLQYVLVNIERTIHSMSNDAQYLSGMVNYTPPSITLRMAMVVTAVLPIIILFPFFQKFLKTGLTIGAVKE